MILIAYDGSEDANAAIDRAAKLAPHSDAVVLTVWSPAIDVLIAPVGYAVHPSDHADLDAASERHAAEIARAGAERATAAGLAARPVHLCRSGSIARTVLAEAAGHDADAIVVGSRGLGGMRSLFMGSVSRAVLHDADRAVLVVPSESVARERAETHHLMATTR